VSDRQLAPRPDGYDPLRDAIETTHSRATRHRARRFLGWLELTGRQWYEPDLALYRDYLLSEGIAPRSVYAYLASVRSLYGDVLKDNRTRDYFYSLAPATAPALERKAFVDELVTRLTNATDPSHSRVSVQWVQDRDAREFRWLTADQARALVEAPDTSTLRGARDAAILALLLSTGVRVFELCALRVDDLRGYLGREPALVVRAGKGNKQRLVAYGEMIWCLDYVERWLKAAEIRRGYVLRGIIEGRIQRVRQGRMATDTARLVLQKYPIEIEGELVTLTPHDLRRSYARLQYEAGMDLVALQHNLGHASHDTTIGYIGDLTAERRAARLTFRPGGE